MSLSNDFEAGVCRSCGGLAVVEDQCTPCRRAVARARVEVSAITVVDRRDPPLIRPARRDRHRGHLVVDRALVVLGDANLVELGRRLHDVITVEASNPSRPDGFPSSTPGAPPAAGSGHVPDGNPHEYASAAWHSWEQDHAPVSLNPVERAADVLVFGRHRDEYASKVDAALEHLARAVHEVQVVARKLGEITRFGDDAGLQPGDPGCWALARIGMWEEVRSTVVIDGEPRALGTWAYGFHRRIGRLPSIAECNQHAEGRKVFTPADRSRP